MEKQGRAGVQPAALADSGRTGPLEKAVLRGFPHCSLPTTVQAGFCRQKSVPEGDSDRCYRAVSHLPLNPQAQAEGTEKENSCLVLSTSPLCLSHTNLSKQLSGSPKCGV